MGKHTPKHDAHPDSLERNEKHDAYFCKVCDAWLESQCTDSDCEFCPNRPEKPSMVMEVIE